MIFGSEDKVQEIVEEYPNLYSVAERLCPETTLEKDLSLGNLATQVGCSPDFIVTILKMYLDKEFPNNKSTLFRYPLSYYINYLQRTHQYYLNKKLPEIEQTLHSLIQNYKYTHLILFALGHQLMHYKKKLILHIQDEESTLIPHIRFLIAHAEEGNFDYNIVSKNLDKYRVEDFITEHSDIESDLVRTRQLIMKYSLASDISITHRIFLNQLETFEFDLMLHSRIEDDIVVPKAKALEDVLLQMIKNYPGFSLYHVF